MNVPQTSYANDLTAAIKGQVDLSDPGNFIVSRYCAAASGISAGMGVVGVASYDRKVVLPSGTIALFDGVAVYDASRRPGAYGAALPNGTASAEGVAVLKRGKIRVYSGAAVANHGAVYLRHTAHSALVPGDFDASADLVASAATCVLVAGAEWCETTTGAGLAWMRINLPA